MKKKMRKMTMHAVLAVLVAAALGGCSGGGDGGATAAGQNSVVYTQQAASLADCPNGGVQINAGIDTNSNGFLDAAEITSTQYVCNGADGPQGPQGTSIPGVSAGVAMAEEPAGTNCVFGGKVISVGPDTNSNGALDVSEITSSDYVCYLAYAVETPPTAPTFRVKDTTGAAVEGALVYAIPAADVAEIAAQPITLGTDGNYTAAARNVDEPLEDLINGNVTPASGGVSAYKSAITDVMGRAVIASLATGTTDRYFIYVKPASADASHLPGGSLCRSAMTGAALDNTETEIKVSTTPSSAATFVGSTKCLSCHQTYDTEKQTLHKIGIMAPGAPSGLQDLAKFGPTEGLYNFAAGLEKFTAGDSASGGTTVWFSDYDSTRKFDKFKTLESAPTGTVYATVRLYKDTGDNKYKMQFTNIINPADPNAVMTFEAVLNYGGGLYKQRYMTTVPGKDSIYMLPLQYNAAGSDSSTARTRKVWRDYHLDWWVSQATSTTMTFKTVPSASNSFDVQCAPCHYNGYSVTKDADNEFVATGVADANGEIHPVTGLKQELNIGCETCHGPGSEHVSAGGAGRYIVSPSNITPERANMLCGQCHSRAQGNDTLPIKKDSPLNASNRMMVAGTSRADFLASNTSRHDASSGDFWSDGRHSKSHHQQYTDLIQSAKYRNGSNLVTCTSCHDPHAPGSDRHQLSGVSDNTACTSCHTTVVLSAHMTTKTGFDMGAGALCIDCHNVKTSSSGAGSNATNPKVSTSGIKYFQGDISSHRFDVPLKSSATPTSDPMPVPYTNNCGTCHDMGSTPQ